MVYILISPRSAYRNDKNNMIRSILNRNIQNVSPERKKDCYWQWIKDSRNNS